MSRNLIMLARKFVSLQITADEFETHFFHMWRNEGSTGQLTQDSKDIGECAAELFILADCYTSDSVRRESELDSDGLHKEVKATLAKYQLL
ncbi:TPA: colicin immunity domain-containing protein [Klebsiella pneumoniae]|uniref:colicin immunity domain-containing protein n=1 Tax=Enterobacteriaceae TaxID=543 RepID=UPI000C1EDA34|nr:MULTISPECIES: colicin immunity domain-containing protein [Enterobacteriaceae]HCC2453036.1 colicin immunity protein [Klebsiella variicola]HCI6917700.1 colicin immunity protein [Klebsiella quasipneumoniae subsp. similipneumoniae]EIW8726508.1 colicin immunity protein [Klebsiella pneumoniae]ELA2414200.1 colicin immunity protein [Klebsiella pneumoniae]EMC8228961.1 colicin immunity protein [Klebsiella pneumoniae]